METNIPVFGTDASGTDRYLSIWQVSSDVCMHVICVYEYVCECVFKHRGYIFLCLKLLCFVSIYLNYSTDTTILYIIIYTSVVELTNIYADKPKIRVIRHFGDFNIISTVVTYSTWGNR